MAQVVYTYCRTWSLVFREIRDALGTTVYPGTLPGGGKNVCCITGHLTTPTDGTEPFDVVVTNEGAGGAHSEPIALALVSAKRRRLVPRRALKLFTERAPCASCRASIERWADTFGRDILVQYLTPWTDTVPVLPAPPGGPPARRRRDWGLDRVGRDVPVDLDAVTIRRHVRKHRAGYHPYGR